MPAGTAPRSARRSPTTCAGLTARLGLPGRLSEVGVPEEGIPDLVEGAMGDGLHAGQPARADRGGLRRALPQRAVSAGDEAPDWAGIVAAYGEEARRPLRADRRAQPGDAPGRAVPRRHQQAHRRAGRGLLGGVAATPRARGGRAVLEGGAPGARSWRRRTRPTSPGRCRSFNVESIEARPGGPRRARRHRGARSSSRASSSTSASSRPCRASTTRSRCARCSAPAFSTGRRRSTARSTSASPSASSTSCGACASAASDELELALKTRGRAVRARAPRARGAQRDHGLPRGPLARGPGAVSAAKPESARLS